MLSSRLFNFGPKVRENLSNCLWLVKKKKEKKKQRESESSKEPQILMVK